MSTRTLNRESFSRLPRHIGFIPDGNRRWAEQRGLPRSAGYAAGVEPGLRLLEASQELGINEVSIYGFTKDNTHRAREQTEAYRAACVAFAWGALERGVALLAVGDTTSPLFPEELLPYANQRQGPGPLRVNLLVNYGWNWDMQTALLAAANGAPQQLCMKLLASAEVSRIDLIVRWGGRRRLSGFLPIQSVYADFFVVDALWPDYAPEHFETALRWYTMQDITLGG